MTTTLFNVSMVEASRYLNIPYDEFLTYVTKDLIPYKLQERERLFTKNDLYKFKTEVLDNEQLLTIPVNLGLYTQVDSLEESDRGSNGFGSTGI